MVWRIVIALYAFAWLIVHPLLRSEFGAKWLIFFTNLSYIQFVLTLLLLALLTVIYTILYYCNRRLLHSQLPDYTEGYPLFYSQDNINFAVKFVWFMYTAAVTLSLAATLGYFVFVFEGVDVATLHVHGINFLVILLDLFLSRFPLQLFHFVWIMAFSIPYVAFTGIYYAAGGTGFNDTHYIYSVLDYRDSPGPASGYAILLAVAPALLHPVLWLVVFLRDLVYKRISCCFRDIQEVRENGKSSVV